MSAAGAAEGAAAQASWWECGRRLNLHCYVVFLAGVYFDRRDQGLKLRFVKAALPSHGDLATPLSLETAKAIDPEGWLHSGDMATMREDETIRFLGRYKELQGSAQGRRRKR